MKEILEFIKGIIRPVIIFWGLGFYTACFFQGLQMPELIKMLVVAIAGEYVIERAVKRWKETK